MIRHGARRGTGLLWLRTVRWWPVVVAQCLPISWWDVDRLSTGDTVSLRGDYVGEGTVWGYHETWGSWNGGATAGTQAQWVSEPGVGAARSGDSVSGSPTLLSAGTFDHQSYVGSMPYVSTYTGEMPHDYLGRSPHHPVRVWDPICSL